jgi:capsid protein
LPPGVDVKFSVPPATGPDAVAHIRQELLAYCAANGVPYEVVTGDLTGVSDRALKLILQEFHRLVDQHRWLHLLPQFCQPIRAAFWDAAVLGGQLRVPDYAARREWYQETEWVPHGFPYSHPVQDVNADVTAVKAGFESRSGIALRRGNDPEAIDAEQEQDNARAELLGLVYDTDTSARNVPTQGAE